MDFYYQGFYIFVSELDFNGVCLFNKQKHGLEQDPENSKKVYDQLSGV